MDWVYLAAGSVFAWALTGMPGVKQLRGRKKKHKSVQPSQPFQELLDYKRERRKEEFVEWQAKWDAILPPVAIVNAPTGPPRLGGYIYDKNDLRMLQSNYGPKTGKKKWEKGWDGLHHRTCPYECDCPQRFRGGDGPRLAYTQTYYL